MSERARGPQDVDTGERMATLARATADAAKHQARGEHETEEGARYTVDPALVETLIDSWPEAPKMAARQMMEQYGAPRTRRRRPNCSGTGTGRGSGPS